MQGVSIVAKILERYWNRNILVHYDPDPDGVFAGHAVHEFLDYYSKPHQAYINRNRGHGVLLDTSDYTGYLIWNVDSGISWSRLKEIVDSGVSIISIDHHELEGTPDFKDNCTVNLTTDEIELMEQGLMYYCNEELGTEGVIINNQYEFEDKKYRFMSGCGVVLKVLEQLNPDFIKDEHIAWHGITLLSDSREIENEIARNILEHTYTTNIESTVTIKHITDGVGFNNFELGENTLDRTYIDFYLNPYINAMLRLNKGYEVISWFSGGDLKTKNAKEQQKEILKELKRRIVSAELDNLLLVNVEKLYSDRFEASNFIGLLANRLLVDGKTVVITCTYEGEFERGSVRGYHNSIDYRQMFEDAGLIALGHKGAFGLKSYKQEYSFWIKLDKQIGVENATAKSSYVIHVMRDLSKQRSFLKELAYENQFLRPFHKHYIKYTGLKFFPSTTRPEFQEYSVNGIPVKCFDDSINIRNGHILPSMSKGYLSLYLERIVTK